jgi:hypothetical protein
MFAVFVAAVASAPLVVDLVLLGYDMGLVELRLCELGGVVDVVVVYEAPFDHAGRRKGRVFDAARVREHAHKILYLFDDEEALREARRAVLSGEDAWALEHTMGHRPAVMIHEEAHPLAARLRGGWGVITQADGDEIMSAGTVAEVRALLEGGRRPPFYVPTVLFKGGFDTVRATADMRWSDHPWRKYLWRPGVTLTGLRVALGQNDTRRDRDGGVDPGRRQMLWVGYGVHLSSRREVYGLKQRSVVERMTATDFGGEPRPEGMQLLGCGLE